MHAPPVDSPKAAFEGTAGTATTPTLLKQPQRSHESKLFPTWLVGGASLSAPLVD